MSTPVLSRREIDFILFDWLAVDRLTARPRFAEHGRDTFEAVLDLAERMATDQFAPHNRLSDLDEPRFVDGGVAMIPEIGRALRAFGEAGLFAASADASLGGLQLPSTVANASMAFFKAANIATTGYALLTVAAANLLARYGTADQVERYAKPMLQGRFFGTMALSEPQAGSSLADITTRAEKRNDGTYRLFGRKMWISGGDQSISENIVHLVLARVPGAPAGVRGISLFAVPKFIVDDDGGLGARNDVALAGLNHKMGYRGTTNTLLNFGERGDGAVATLVGEENNGLACMFHMMNEARIGVGMGAAALGCTGYLHALDYARGRPQGRATGARGDTAPVPIIEHADVRRMLLAQKCYGEYGLALCLFCASLVDEERTAVSDHARGEAHALLELLTPVAKSWPSQWCLEANSLAIQVHGGYGYTRDYPVEQFYRDNRLNPIHEGTHGIQALDLVGRKIPAEGGRGLALFRRRVEATVAAARAGGEADAARWADRLEDATARVAAVAGALAADRDRGRALGNATLFLEAFGHLVVAWIALDQTGRLAGRADAFARGKRHACRFFFVHELGRIDHRLSVLAAEDTTTRDMDPAWF